MSARGIIFNLNEDLFLKDPQTTSYGQKLLENSIELIDGMGIEGFTFKKLAVKISSTEASIYRYFENKHKLLLYLTCWYWEWVHFLIDLNVKNIEAPEKALKITIHNIVNASTESPMTTYVNENLLHNVIIKEGSKTYHNHEVDDENELGFFQSYKGVVSKVADIIKKYNPEFPYPKMLASNLFEMANNQIFYAEHLPRLTEIKNRKKKYEDLEAAMRYIVFKVLN